ncbi:MAG: SIS domain-containing protein [Halioglobus sp.]|nr:SIS domain-containing protein [Halioglobus sp.]
MDHYRLIAKHFQDTVETVTMSVDGIAEGITQGSEMMAKSLLMERKIVACGNGVDATLAQLLTCHLLDRFEADRPALPALTLTADPACLTAIAGSDGFDDIYSRQLQAMGQDGDVLLCISTIEFADNLMRTIGCAKERNIAVIALTSAGNTALYNTLEASDVLIQANASRRAHLVELFTMVIHSLCGLIDQRLFGSYSQG